MRVPVEAGLSLDVNSAPVLIAANHEDIEQGR
jgi:hypothetical protein